MKITNKYLSVKAFSCSKYDVYRNLVPFVVSRVVKSLLTQSISTNAHNVPGGTE